MNNATCISRNIIYIIICNRCSLFYVGESSKSLKERTSQHINHIINFIPYKKYENKEVARHFRSKKHKITDFKICVFKTEIENDEIRKNIEQDLINRLNTKLDALIKLHLNKVKNLYLNSIYYLFLYIRIFIFIYI